MKILAVDPGSKHIGIAISDLSGSVAKPLTNLTSTSYKIDAVSISNLAQTNNAELIIVGQSFDDNNEPTFAGRRSERLANAIKMQCNIPVEMWDEAFTTKDSRETRIQMGVKRKKRSGHLDSLAAAILLQSYLDQNRNTNSS